jgi:hypothetical protein
MNTLPILIKNSKGMALVEVDGQAVITAKNMAESLEYKSEKAILMTVKRNKASFRDAGVFDITRGCQNVTPLSGFDTAIVRLLTPSASDGRGGGVQDVRVFTKRGALKVCMKSNQRRAVMVQEMLIDLYEKVEAGMLIGAERFGRALETLSREVGDLKREISHLKAQPPISITLPTDTALPITLERKRSRSGVFCKGLKIPEIRDLILALRRAGKEYREIANALKDAFPGEPIKWVSKSAVHRFWSKARSGHLKEFGIDVTIH